MDFDFFMPVRIFSGEGAVKKNSDIFSNYGEVAGIVTGKHSAKQSGALKDVTQALEEQGIQYLIYDKITENPLIEICHEAGTLFRENKVDFIIGIGGGSPLDASKAVAIYASNGELTPEDIYIRKYDNKPLPVLLIGTTAGTGSEVSAVSVLTNGKTGRKKSISGADCYAKVVFADSSYTSSMPYDVTVSTALDALCHAVEGFFCAKYTDIPAVFAERAIPMLWECLKELDREKQIPNSQMREKLYYGSLYAGMVLNQCGTLFPHPLGYVLTENYNVPHGKACAMFMRDLISIGCQYAPKKTQLLMSLTDAEIEDFCDTVDRLTNLSDIKMSEEEINAFCSRWDDVRPANFKNTPNGFTKDDAVSVFRQHFLN